MSKYKNIKDQIYKMDLELIEKISDISDEKETLSMPVGVTFTPSQFKRWESIRARLKKYNDSVGDRKKKKVKIADFARIALESVMDKLDRLLSNNGF